MVNDRKPPVAEADCLRRNRAEIFICYGLHLREPLHILAQGRQKGRIQLLENRKDLVADAVALVGGISVGAVLPPPQTVRDGIFMNILPRESEQRTDDPRV